MRKPSDHIRGHNPFDSYAPKLFEQHPASSETGIAIRRGDAWLRLQEIRQSEAAVKHQEAINTHISDNIAREQAEHQLNMQYLIQFGVRADERLQFQQLLEQIAEHGGLSLREAANLTHVIAQRNGSVDSSDSSLVASGLI
ncbi:hypothetical protein [Gimesia panareensis]|uniref:hypothetical protein n=1 Tax=Gimesia panareensis TaxID=2527978 RepID=UPI00118B5782|nr:hypothetical protein [Gimesia panareensis]QDU52981.1 hypothetical protein Pan110_53630 [Gimesia panareensis]